jgi:hypothetical protein
MVTSVVCACQPVGAELCSSRPLGYPSPLTTVGGVTEDASDSNPESDVPWLFLVKMSSLSRYLE